MTDATLMNLIIWLESAACRCFYIFEDLDIKPRFMTKQKKEKREMFLQDSQGLVKLCQFMYTLQLPYKKENA